MADAADIWVLVREAVGNGAGFDDVAEDDPDTDPAAGTAWAPGPTERESLSSWRQYIGSLECPHYCGLVVQGVEGCRVRVLFSFVGGTGHAEPMVPIAHVLQDAGHTVASR